MPVKLPKYAHWVAERRFVVDTGIAPKLDETRARRIEDLYIDGGRLRPLPSVRVVLHRFQHKSDVSKACTRAMYVASGCGVFE